MTHADKKYVVTKFWKKVKNFEKTFERKEKNMQIDTSIYGIMLFFLAGLNYVANLKQKKKTLIEIDKNFSLDKTAFY